jgi:hypothetical protein
MTFLFSGVSVPYFSCALYRGIQRLLSFVFLMKNAPSAELLQAIRSVYALTNT